MKLKFEHLFQDHILDRGFNLVDKVKDIKVKSDAVEGIVSGSYDYEVKIECPHNEVLKMTCTCPYAEDNRYCKHMAAVLYTLTEKEDSALYEAISKDQLIGFLEEHFKKDHDLYQAFMIKFKPLNVDAEDMKKKYDQILRHYLGREGFINYQKAPSFYSEMDQYLESLYDMNEQGLHEVCLEIITYFTKDFDHIPLDDSDGGTGVLYDELILLLEAMLEASNDKIKREIYDWMDQVISNPHMWYLRERLYPLWASQESEGPALEAQICQLEKRLSLKTTETNDSYDFNKEIITYGDLLLKRGDDFKQVMGVIKPFKENTMVYKWLIETCEAKNLTDLQLTFINEALNFGEANGFYGFIKDVNQLRLAYYKKINDHETYKTVLRQCLLSGGELDYWKQYKSLLGQGWEVEKEELINVFVESKKWNILYDIYAFENMNHQLMALIEKYSSVDKAEQYFNQLKDDYLDTLLKLYLDDLNGSIESANSRQQYKAFIRRFKSIKKKFNNHESFSDQIEAYRLKYKKRSAFIDELNRGKL